MYVLQHPDFNLGNFINITPAILWHHERTGQRVPVYFATEYVRQCFIDWSAIEILDRRPAGTPMFGSDITNNANNLPDYQYAFQVITGQVWTPEYHTYVDTPNLTRPELEEWDGCIAVTNGAGSDAPGYVATKDPGPARFFAAIEESRKVHRRARVIAVGSKSDLKRNPWLKDAADDCYFGNIRTALKILSVATKVIANDTGLAHAAGAMNQNLTVLWKNTPHVRCQNAGVNTQYIFGK